MILELLEKEDIKGVYEELQGNSRATDVEKAKKEYDNERTERLTQVGKREHKTVKTKQGNKVVEVSKIPIPFQRKIVRLASVFLFGSPVNLVPKEANESSKAFLRLWKNLRMDDLLLKFCRTVKSETEAAIVFYPLEKEGLELKAKLLACKTGRLYPVFDEYGKMQAFAWEFDTKEGGKEVKRLRIWTAEKEIDCKRIGNEWITETKLNFFEKIPVVYLSQEHPEWWEVQEMIDRFEMRFSRFADTNDYFGEPMWKVKGTAGSMPEKDDTGRMVKVEMRETSSGRVVESDIDVVTWDHAPEAVKMEFEILKGLIYDLTDTPNLSFDNVKGLGSISGVALELMFLSPIFKALEAQGEYSTVVSRVVNILLAGSAKILKQNVEALEFDIKFTSVLPKNILENIQMLSEATGGKPVMSQETAIAHNLLVSDSAKELERIKTEEELALGETF